MTSMVEGLVREWAEDDCEYGDGCPSSARHYRCLRCKAIQALDYDARLLPSERDRRLGSDEHALPPEGAGVVKLRTRPELEADARQAEDEQAHEEGMDILRRALEWAEKRQLAGALVVLAFADGAMARLLPEHSTNGPLLLGAVALAQADLGLATLGFRSPEGE